MDLGISEILLIGGIIVVFVLISKGKKSAELKRQQEAERLEALRVARMANRIRYPQLQLLGFVVILAGIAMAVGSYLMTRGIADPLALGGILGVFLGLCFIILARQRVKPVSVSAKNSKSPVVGSNSTKNPGPAKTMPVAAKVETQIKPEDLADFKRYQKEKLAKEMADFRQYQLYKSKSSQAKKA